MTPADVFAGIADGGRVAAYLESALASGKTTHAYLLVGGAGGAKNELARRFAAALVAAGDEEQFSLACKGAHPDVHFIEPGGASGYLIDQVRALVHDVDLAPVRAARKVYVVSRADRLLKEPANAFLKTLEEPPADVVCILLAENEQSVLETLRSRCEVLVLGGAASHQPGDSELFSQLFTVCSGCDDRTLLAYARRFVELAQAEADACGEEAPPRDDEFLSASAKRELEKRDKRNASTRRRRALLAQVGLVGAWLRDCLMVQQGAQALCAYPECEHQTRAVATSAPSEGVVKALAAVRSCTSRISYNVSPQLAVEAMFIEIREALCQQ